MTGGAAGDALGYAVEFMRLRMIKQEYGNEGITSYDIQKKLGHALISDDTQMSLFTANGILMYDAHNHNELLTHYVYLAYLDWLKTQAHSPRRNESHCTWLYEIPELHSRRAPGMTCTSALASGKMGTIARPLNDSKGCGGIMRIAPLALRYIPENDDDFRTLDTYGAEISAITHGHSLGYLPSAILTHIISCVMQSYSLTEAINEAWSVNRELFDGIIPETHLDDMNNILELAMKLSGSKHDDGYNIREIGGGWVAEETLAIALYCALRYTDDFSRAIIASVNHDGDSDSTGAVTGNIMGAIVGYDAIADKWKDNLELRDLILEVSDDLCSNTWPEGRYSR